MNKIEKRLCRREVKSDTRKLGIGLLIYFVITFATVIIYDVIASLTFMKDATTAEFETFSTNEGVSSIIGVLVGTAFLLLFFMSRKTHKQIFVKNKKMTLGWFAVLFCIFLGIQLIIDPIFMGFEAVLNLIGLSAKASMEAATSGNTTTISMLIYGGIVAPVIEEIVYRGFAMRLLGKYGKTFAILASSILFGVMHGNIPQAMFATLVGIVLGYVAMEYSIIWSIVLHMLNNLVFGELLYFAISNTSDLVQNIVWYSLVGICFVVGVVAMIIKRKQIMAYIRKNKWELPCMKWTFTTGTIILFILINLGIGLLMLEKI